MHFGAFDENPDIQLLLHIVLNNNGALTMGQPTGLTVGVDGMRKWKLNCGSELSAEWTDI